MSDAERAQLRVLDPSSPGYRTPRAGEGFKTSIFGREVEVAPRDRRSTTAWDVGIAAWIPWPEAAAIRPFASLYLWRRPDENSFLRGTLVLLMAVERIQQFADALLAGGRPADTPVVVVQEGTRRTQRVLRADLQTVAAHVRDEQIRPPAIIVIGPVAGLTADSE